MRIPLESCYIISIHSRRLNHSETYVLLSTDREQDIQQCINEKRGHFSNRLMVDTQYKVWGAVKHIKLMAESDRIRKLKGQRRRRRSKKRLLNPEHAMYMFFEKQGFNYNEVLANCEFLSSHHSMHQLRWAVLCMQVERKEVREMFMFILMWKQSSPSKLSI